MPRSPRETTIAWAECLRRGDFPGLVALHHENLVCGLLGHSLVSGRFRGRDAFFAHTIKHVMGSMAETDEVYLKDYRIVCADELYSVMLLHGGLPTRAGGRYDQNYLQVFRVENGLITETHELLDTVMLETQVFLKSLYHARCLVTEPLVPESRYQGSAAAISTTMAETLESAFYEALRCSDRVALFATLHPNAVLQIAGTTPASGTIRGRTAIERFLTKYLLDHFRDGLLQIVGSSRLACRDSSGFCRLANVRGELLSGSPYEQIVGVAACFGDGAIVDLYLYFDTAEEERQVFNNPLRGGVSGMGPEPFSIDIDASIVTLHQ